MVYFSFSMFQQFLFEAQQLMDSVEVGLSRTRNFMDKTYIQLSIYMVWNFLLGSLALSAVSLHKSDIMHQVA